MDRLFYVYTLTDPRDGKVFYVGKGSGCRMFNHVREAIVNKCQSNRPKIDLIRKIQEAGLQPRAEKVAEFFSEFDALEHEKHLIASLPGLLNIRSSGLKWGITKEERSRRDTANLYKIDKKQQARTHAFMRDWIGKVDSWGNEMEWFFPNMKNGAAEAKELISFIRNRVAQLSCQPI